MMFKITTAVKIGVCTLAIVSARGFADSSGTTPAATTSSCSLPVGTNLSDIISMATDASNPSKQPYAKQILADQHTCTTNTINGSGNTTAILVNCTNAGDQLKSAMSAFNNSCAKALHVTSGDSYACAAKVKKCDASQTGNLAVGGSSYASGSASSIDENRPYNMGVETKRLADCPIYPGTDLKTLADQVDQQKKSIDGLKDKLTSAKQAALTAKTQGAQQDAASLKEGAANEKEHGQAMLQISQAATQQSDQIKQKMTDLQNQMTQKYGELDQITTAESAAAAAMEDAKVKIRLNCYTQASDQVTQAQKAALDRMSAGMPISSGQNDFLQKVGMTSRQAWQQLATTYYNWCLSSQPTVDSYKSANNAYNLAIQQQEQLKKTKNLEIAGLKDQMLQTVNPNGCAASGYGTGAGSSGEASNCAQVRQTQQQLAAEQDSFDKQKAALDQERQTNAQNAMESAGINSEQVGRATLDLNNETIRLGNLQAYYALKMRATGGQDTSQDDYNDLLVKLTTLKDVATQTVDAVGTCQPDDPNKDSTTKNAKVAQAFLAQLGINVNVPNIPTVPSASLTTDPTVINPDGPAYRTRDLSSTPHNKDTAAGQ